MKGKREKLYSVSETAEMLGYSAYTVYRWLRTGKLKGYHLSGSKWRISDEHINELLGSGEELKEVE